MWHDAGVSAMLVIILRHINVSNQYILCSLNLPIVTCQVYLIKAEKKQYLNKMRTGIYEASQVTLVAKNLPINAVDIRDVGLIPGMLLQSQFDPWQPTPVFLSGEFHGQRSLAGYSPLGHQESDTTEAT